MSDLERPEYMCIPMSQITARIQSAYNVANFARNDRVLVEITKGIYGLPQASLLAKRRLDAHLSANGYHESITYTGFIQTLQSLHHVYLSCRRFRHQITRAVPS